MRGLLAKATRTEFPEEARALTLKAQELMVRHALTEAQLQAAGQSPRDDIVTTVISVEAPYRNAKGLLLCGVAAANRCQVVEAETAGAFHHHVTGFSADVADVEMLFTSLLVQAAHQMLRCEPDPWVNKRSFRHGFLVGFATEIGDRLAARSAESVAIFSSEASTGASGAGLLPVLADRRREVDQEVERLWGGRLRTSRVSYRPGAGYTAGTRAARRADLAQRRLGSRRALQR